MENCCGKKAGSSIGYYLVLEIEGNSLEIIFFFVDLP
jgi:hypothetical protein